MSSFPNINFLRYFYSAGKNQSVSKAAEENFVSQSAISQGINKLEIEIGKQLVTNCRNRFQLTPEGGLLLEKCEGVFSLFNEINDLFNEKEGVYKGKLTIATSYSFGISLLPMYYEKLLKQHPEVQPILRLGHTGLIREFVTKGQVDFGVVLAHGDVPGFDSRVIFSGEHRLYHVKKRPKKTTIDRLIISEDQREDHVLIDHLKKEGKGLPPMLEVLSWEAIASMTKRGLGVGFLPDYVAKAHDLVPFPAKLPKIPYQILAIYSKNRTLTRNAHMFINLMCEDFLC